MSRTTRVNRGAKQDDPKPSRRQETFKVTSERAQEARRRAQQCFLSMIEGPVEPNVFIAKARYINPEVYDDVVVERAVAGLCGYPMCPNTFTDTYGSRIYVIRSNKLYDITERRNFCSNVCFEASELVRKQVLTLPLYLRDTQDSDIKDVRLPCQSKLNGRHGKLVDITGGISNLELNEDEKPRGRRAAFTSVDDIARESLVNWSENEADLNKEQIESISEVDESGEADQSTPPTESKSTDQNKTTTERNDSNQNRTVAETTETSNDKTITDGFGREHTENAREVIESSKVNQNVTAVEETGKGQANSTENVKDSNDADQCRAMALNSDTNQRVPADKSTNTAEKTDSTVVHKECSPLPNPSENQPQELGYHKEGVGGQGDHDVQKQFTKEESLNKEDSGYESTKEERESEIACDTFQKISEGDKDEYESSCAFVAERANKDKVKVGGVQEGSVCGKKDYSPKIYNKEYADDGTALDVQARGDQRLKTDTAKKGAHKLEPCEDPNVEVAAVDPFVDVHKVEAMMRQWVSFDSLRVVLGDLYVRGMLEHLGRSWDNYETTSGLRLSVEAKARYISICRRLEHEEKQDEREGQDKLDLNLGKQSRPSKPLPDYSQLQHQAEKQQLKVVSFLGGSDQYEEPVEEKLESIPEEEGEESKSIPFGKESTSNPKGKLKSKKQSENSNTRDPTLPFVDSYSQVAWRQNIVVEKITAYLQQLLEMTRLSVHEVKKLLGPLVATFHLSPDNISFRPKQWRLITLIILRMLSVRYPAIQNALKTKEGLSMQGNILSAFSLDLGYCDRVLSYLTEIQHVLSKDFKDEKTMNDSQSDEVLQKLCPEGENLETSRAKGVESID